MATPRVKGNVVRAWVKIAERHGLLAQVRSKLSPSTLAVFQNPPLSGSWIDSRPLTEFFLAVYDTAGRAAALKLSRESTDEVAPFYSGMLGGLLRIFGATPQSLFSRLNDFSKQTMEGVEYRWTKTGETSGTIEVVYPPGYTMTQPQYLTIVPSFEFMFRLCKARGKVSEPVLLSDHSARFEVSW